MSVGLHNFINDYFNDINGYRRKYKNVGLYMEENHKIFINNICNNNDQYNKIV